MAKIDCSVTVNFLREWKRYCSFLPCSECLLNWNKACQVKDDPDRAVEIVQAWSDEHPTKTRLDDLLEKFPNTPLREDGLLDFLPTRLGYCKDCRSCRYFEKICSEVCWHEPLDGGATGKAVE